MFPQFPLSTALAAVGLALAFSAHAQTPAAPAKTEPSAATTAPAFS